MAATAATRAAVRTPLSQAPPVDWYASGTFWAIAAVAVAVIAIAVGTWSAFRSANPRRHLHITEDSLVSLLPSGLGLGDDVEVHRRGKVLSNPHVITVSLVSRSARDIPRAAFDGTPLTLDFGVPVIGLLEQWSDPGRAAVCKPSVTVTATALTIGPALLTRSHELRYTVLVDGEPNLAIQGELADVHIHTKPPRPRMTPAASC
ncbi:hypothetical protein [Saccharothrix sp. NRRL B-16314]|uniref:hypothetical protein n=1 Tax=Saccharothrix sp. NRRL B-16314 TaxID=1463825 RepID=UPI0012DCEBA0|nr:hypothetical protein [Saccharothrix sp. NRRL B-16314]